MRPDDASFGTPDPKEPKSWTDTATELGVRKMEPAKRLEAFEGWQKKTGDYLVNKGELSTPEEIADWKRFELRQKRKLSDKFMVEPRDVDVDNDLAQWSDEVSRYEHKPVDVRLIRKPEEYRKAVMDSDAPFDIKIMSLANRDKREPEFAVTRRNELSQTVAPKAMDITEALQSGQEFLGMDIYDPKGDIPLQKEDGEWTVPSTSGDTFWEKAANTLQTSGGIARVPMKELSEYQKKYGLSDEEMQADYMEALKATAPSSVSRWFGNKTDIESISPELSSSTRVLNKDIGQPSIVVPDRNLAFKKEEYDAAIDATEGVSNEVKEVAKKRRDDIIEQTAPGLFNALQNWREDFKPYAKEAEQGKGTDAPKMMAKAISDYYADKKDQSWIQDLGEFAGQMGSSAQEGFFRASAMPYSLAGFLGNDTAGKMAADVSRGIASQAQVDEMVSGNLGLPGVTKFARDVTNVLPDVAQQLALAIPTGGLTTASAATRIATAANVESNVARQALQIAVRNGGELTATTNALKAAGLAETLAKPAVESAKWLTSKNLIKGGQGRQIALQSGYAGASQMAATYSQITNQLMDEGMTYEEASGKARFPAAVSGAITAAVTGLFSAGGHGGIEKPVDPGKYTVRDLLRTGLLKELKDPAVRKIVKQTRNAILRDVSDEAIEEGLDQFINGVAAFATDPSKATQDKRIGDVISESAYAAAVGGAAGGAAGAARQLQSTNALTGEQIKASEKLKEIVRNVQAEEKKAGGRERAPITPIAPLPEEPSVEDLENIGKQAANEAVEVADELSLNPDTELTAKALRDVATEVSGETDQPGDRSPVRISLTPTDAERASGAEPGNASPQQQITPGQPMQGTIAPEPAVGAISQPIPSNDPFAAGETGVQPPETGETATGVASPDVAAAVETQPTPTDALPQTLQNSPQQTPQLQEGPQTGTEAAPTGEVPLERSSQSDGAGQPADSGVAPAARPVLSFSPDATVYSPENERVRASLNELVGDVLPTFENVFTGVEVIDQEKDINGKPDLTGGFYYNPRNGKLGVVLRDVGRESGKVKNQRKWAVSAILEEAIHAVVDKLERSGELSSLDLLNKLKEDAPKLYKKFRAAYKTSNDEDAAQEFIRMLVQGKIRFSARGVNINGEFTEMQFTDRVIKAIKDVLQQILTAIRDLKKHVSKELATELEAKEKMISRTLKALTEMEAPAQGATKGGGDTTALRKGAEDSVPPVSGSLNKEPTPKEKVKSEKKAEPDEDFTFIDPEYRSQSSDAMQEIPLRFDGAMDYGEYGQFENYTITLPGYETTLTVDKGTTPEELQEKAREKIRLFDEGAKSRGIRSQSSDNFKRGQILGVKNLSAPRKTERFAAVKSAVQDKVFNGQAADPKDEETQMWAHDLIRMVQDPKQLKVLQDSLEGHDALEKAEIGTNKEITSLPGSIYEQLMQYAVRMATEGGAGGTADLSLVMRLVREYPNVLDALMKSEMEWEGKSTSRAGRQLASLKMVSKEFGTFISFYAQMKEQMNSEMRRIGFTDEEIAAIDNHLEGKISKKELDEALKRLQDENSELQKKLDAANNRIASLLQSFRKKVESGEITEEGGGEKKDWAKPPKLTKEEKLRLPKSVQEAYDAAMRGKLEQHIAPEKLKEIEDNLYNARKQLTEDGIQALADAFFVDGQKRQETLLGMKGRTVNSEMSGLIKETLEEMGIVPKENEQDKKEVFRKIAVALGGKQLKSDKVPLIEEAIKTKLTKTVGAESFESALEENEWVQQMWSQWNSVAASLNAESKVSGATLERAIRQKAKDLNLSLPEMLNMTGLRKAQFDTQKQMITDAVMGEMQAISALAPSNVSAQQWKDVRAEVESRIDRMLVNEAKRQADVKREQQALRDLKAQDTEAMAVERARRIMARHATPDTWTEKHPDVNLTLEGLAKMHANEAQSDFLEIAENMGVPHDVAVELDRAISSTRNARAEIKALKEEQAKDKVIQKLIYKMGPKGGEKDKQQGAGPFNIGDVAKAMLEADPDLVHDAAWRRNVLTALLGNLGVDQARIPAQQLDFLLASVFADAQSKSLQKFVKEKVPQKVTPTEMDKLAEAVRVGFVNGAPPVWQSAFQSKFGIKAPSMEQMQDLLKWENTFRDERSNQTDRTMAWKKMSDLYRRLGLDPTRMQVLASSITQSMLTGLATQNLQHVQGAFNFVFRLLEEFTTGVFTGKGVDGTLRAMNQAVKTWASSFGSAIKTDAYRNAQQQEIERMAVLRSVWEKNFKRFQESKNPFTKAKALINLGISGQDFFRRFMQSSDDGATSGIEEFTRLMEHDSTLKKMGFTGKEIQEMYDLSWANQMDLMQEAEARGYTGATAKMWVRDEVNRNFEDAIVSVALGKAKQAGKDLGLTHDEVTKAVAMNNQFAKSESEVDVGVGKERDTGHPLDLQFWGEWMISQLEKSLHMDPESRDYRDQLKYIAARALFGFLRIPFNVASRAVFRGPLGLWRMALTMGKDKETGISKAEKYYARSMGSERQRQQRWKEVIVNSAFFVGILALKHALSGDDEDKEDDGLIINGNGPKDKQAQAAWRAAGHKANTIELTIGDQKIWIPFGRSGLEPVKPMLTLLSTWSDLELSGLPKGTAPDVSSYALNFGLNTLTNSNLFGLRNIMDMRDVMNNNGDTEAQKAAWVKKIAYPMSGFVPYSGLVKSIGRIAMPDKADDKTIAGAIAASTPLFFLGEKGVNTFGLPVYGAPNSRIGDITSRLMYSMGVPFSVDVKGDPKTAEALAWVVKTGNAPSAKNRKDFDEQQLKQDPNYKPITDEKWFDYLKASGKARLDSMKEFINATDGGKVPEKAADNAMERITRTSHFEGMKAISKK